jgi:hypothetical protein
MLLRFRKEEEFVQMDKDLFLRKALAFYLEYFYFIKKNRKNTKSCNIADRISSSKTRGS